MTDAVKLYEVHALDPSKVKTNGANTRGKIGKADVADLVASIRAQGQLVPIIVRKVDDAYEVVAGHRRLEACKILGGSVLAITIEATDAQALAALLAENEVRTQPDPFRESDAVQRLADLGWDQQTIAAALGKTPRWVAQRARLRNLTPKARKVLEGKRGWPVVWLEEYARLSPEAQDHFLEEAERTYDRRGLDHLFEQAIQTLGNAPWDLEDETLDAKAGSCSRCPKTSAHTPGLFEDADEAVNPKKARCLDASCWARKKEAFVLQGVTRIREKTPEAKTLVLEDGAGGQDAPKLPEGETVLRSWEVVPCKEGQKGAVPVIGIGKRGTAKLMWVRQPARDKTDPPHRGKLPKPKPAKDLPPAAKLKASRERVELRRMAFVVDLLHDFFMLESKIPPAPNPSVVAGLVACYAVEPPPPAFLRKGKKPTRQNLFDLAHAVGPSKWNGWAEEVWPRLRKAICGNLAYGTQETIPAAYEEAVFVGSCIGKTRAELDAAALDAIPDPKGWARLSKEAKAKK